jgi:hypothetical protein
MLILCVGPDAFRAQERVRELAAHFVQKYDKEQVSVERLEASGTALVDQLVERMHTPSLFTPRRFLKTQNLLAECPKGKQMALKQALARATDDTIIVNREEEIPTEALLKATIGETKVTRYDFPLLSGEAFVAFLQQLGKRLQYEDTAVIRKIAEQTQGDTWAAWNELSKCAAGGLLGTDREELASVYELADAFLQARPAWRVELAKVAQTNQAMQAFLGQIRALLRVRDGAAQTLPSFIVRKLQTWRLDTRTEERFARIILYYFLQRSGYANEEEATLILP